MSFEKLLGLTTAHDNPSDAPQEQTMGAMQPIKLDGFDYGTLPPDKINEFVGRVNSKIDQFNSSSDETQKKTLLQDIQKEIQAIDYEYRPSQLASSKGYRAVHAALFRDIKKQMELMGVRSLRSPEAKTLPAAEVIANMSPEKAEKLTAILAKGNTLTLQQELNGLYPEEENSPEAESFRHFLNTHQITFLGGGNSKNFKVVNSVDNSAVVLKVDNRLSMSRKIEARLRDQLPEKFTPIHAERQVTFEDANGETCSRTLLVTDYCTGGNVKSVAEHAQNVDQLTSAALDVFGQMSGTMLEIQNQGYVFPDAKSTNWLVKEDGRLIVADTKSFLSPGLNLKIACTPFYTPPEFEKFNVDADSAHAYILGKNLYNFLTGGKKMMFTDSATDIASNGNGYFSNEPVFEGRKGEELKNLICALVKKEPSERMSVKKANERLLEIMENDVLLDLEGLSIGRNDTTMTQFIAEKRQQLERTRNDPAAHKATIEELKGTVASLQADPVANDTTMAKTEPNDTTAVKTELNDTTVTKTESNDTTVVKTEPSESMLVKKANEELLEKMENDVLLDLEGLRIGRNDTTMTEFIADKRRDLEKVKDNPAKREAIIEELKSTVAGLKADRVSKEILGIVENYRNKAGLFTIGMLAKADKIERAMADVPITERAQLVNSSSGKPVMEALATHRYLGKRGNVYYKSGTDELDAGKAATTYKNFKSRFIEQKDQDSDPVVSEAPGMKK